MNKFWVALVVLIQLAVLSSIALKRERILASADSIYLRTAPVDPRDIFRGDYVTLEYDIAAPDAAQLAHFAENYPEAAEQIAQHQAYYPVYLPVEVDNKGVAYAADLLLEPPSQGLFIKGRMGKGTTKRWMRDNTIKFGIEKYFVEQGKGIEIENRQGKRDEWQQSMEVELALGDDGTPVIKGHRWSDMALRIEVLEEAQAQRNRDSDNAENGRQSAKVKFSIRNESSALIQLPVALAGNCEIAVIKLLNRWSGNSGSLPLRFPARDCSAYEKGEYRLEMLQPQQVYSVKIDFATQPWFIHEGGERVEIGALQDPSVGYRLKYTPPGGIDLAAGQDVSLWLTPVSTAQFTIAGWVD